ncbi:MULTISPECIES: phosphohistidine phosphatase SixA [Marinobacter]|uniref:Phosphohistidine phosphatase SixA n=1 Tax=Marinobacter suaedae TaxID=3057675 RepID=A0ABT8W1Z1_9GAMM|nr:MULTISPECIES: phosphohistidine phosphatase SixA [unclassified Marinobacter]MBZ2168008.1 phosphohistidine phosphatase SixA [Marinobacter sp. F4216]MDO3722262.1 phosphohistidine phosphatase SixA [Marinobacter sp. chi1]
MHLFVMRHGEAGWNTIDQQRELTEIGRHQVAAVAAQVAESEWRPELIWCSPYVRARQTAAIVSEILNCPVDEREFLTPDDDPGACLDALLEAQEWPLMLVSHMPFVGSLSTLLVDGHRHGIPFMTSQAVLLDVPVVGPGCADLKDQFLP